MSLPPELSKYIRGNSALEVQYARLSGSGVEGAWEVGVVKCGGVDGGLQVHAKLYVV